MKKDKTENTNKNTELTENTDAVKEKKSKKRIFLKILKIFLIIIAVLAILCAALAIWQWDNIQAFMLSRKYSSSELLAQLSENDKQLKNEVAKYFTGGIREFTEEEQALIDSGEITEKQMLAKIISEGSAGSSNEEIYNQVAEDQKKTNSDAEITFSDGGVLVPVPVTEAEKADNTNTLVIVGKPTKPADSHEQPQQTANAEDIISKYVSQLYTLEGKYIGAIEGVVAAAKAEAKAKGLTKKDTSQLLAVGANYTNTINALEARCDGEVEAIITNLTNELNAINADTSIIATIRSAYENEKEIKRAYYMNMVYS